ncbi:MAG: hypothetical protein ACP5N3_01660 [Candidatus Nanoarchaeia archaeon]
MAKKNEVKQLRLEDMDSDYVFIYGRSDWDNTDKYRDWIQWGWGVDDREYSRMGALQINKDFYEEMSKACPNFGQYVIKYAKFNKFMGVGEVSIPLREIGLNKEVSAVLGRYFSNQDTKSKK